MRHRKMLIGGAAALAGLTLWVTQAQPPAKAAAVDFQREVRPILSDNCFYCHGPDKSTRMMDLRLDTKEGAFAERKTGRLIVPGDPAASLLYQRIATSDTARTMPPAHSKKLLTAAQKDTLKRWIAQGAPWKEHWAFAAPARPALPAVTNVRWARNPIDRFVLARLEAAGLPPAAEADRRALARRAALDLTGLPPTPELLTQFLQDKSPKAYEEYVDRLLATNQWGEHRARYWLDAARYADTHGIHIDNYREMWPYRDWVIRAFNRNLPFDQFVVEQIAGDLLPNPTRDQMVATGFHRCNPTTNEDGAIADEVEAIYAKDRVDTTGAVFLGLTVGCAACHDHKFDPIAQRDFYALSAFFRNTVQGPLDGNIAETPPVLVIPKSEDEERWKQIRAEEGRLRERLQAARVSAEPAFADWLAGAARKSIEAPLEPADELMAVTVQQGEPRLRVKGKPAELKLPAGITLGEAHIPGRQAIHFSGKSYLELPNVDALQADRPFSAAMWFYLPKSEDSFIVASQTDAKSKGRGWSFELTRRSPSIRLVGQAGRALTITNLIVDRFEPARWYHVAFSYDGKRTAEGFKMFVNGREVGTQGSGRGGMLKGELRNFSPFLIGRMGDQSFEGGAIADLRVYGRVLSEADASLLAQWPAIELARDKSADALSGAERDGLRQYYLTREFADHMDLAGELQSLDAEKLEIVRRGALTHVQHERAGMPSAHLLFRGMYDQPREKLAANTPYALPPMSAALPKNRLGLARWLVDPAHPLTARVAVNRMWQELFGTGLVKTSDDFGSQGEPPSHPELLDWLAVEFRESGWDVKHLYKLMVTSAAYRQAGVATPLKIEKDPENRLLSRGPRFRMDAEMIRDYALAASGLLTPTIGGPSVKPYQPPGVWEAVAMLGSNTRFYQRDSGPALYRRSLYSFWKRSAPPAAMEVLNAPTRENCTVRRERTNTPLQALVTMNDVQFVEAARHLAQRARLAAPENVEKQIQYMAVRLTARDLDARELAVTRKAHQDFLRYYDSHPDQARKLIAQGESKPEASLPPVELAALTMTANQLFNIDEVLVK
ncbi:MAG: DUF1553 domain-containing protein [Acidobacteriaceae bacterium]|nr:DUF1553 domain-containing protein [Acidobacteriaceae bacterium]